MQPLRGTKDILPEENITWQYIQDIITPILSTSNYNQIITRLIKPKTPEIINNQIKAVF